MNLRAPYLTLIPVIILLAAGVAFGQSNYREKKIVITGDTTVIDTLSIIPASFSTHDTRGNRVDSSYFRFEPYRSLLIRTGNNVPDTLVLSYRVFPVLLDKSYYHKSANIKGADAVTRPILFTYSPPKGVGLLTSDELNKQGSISRGITFGNNQNLAVNSFLNLQMSGKIKDNIRVMASVSDDNIPIQPDGNTAQLQDFDQVFIKVYEDNWSVTAGDLWFRQPESYFMRYHKRAQGLSGTVSLGETGKWKYEGQTGGALSKGKFARNVLQGKEGTQGPYKLNGAENESFIIILAGTEQVFIDGVLQKRGQENDYVIDYNTAEITFTPRHLITKDRRIIVEFQYSDKNYARSIVTSNHVWTNPKWKVYANFFDEEDAKNQSLQQTLTDSDKQIMAQVGDSVQYAFNQSIDSIGYNANQVLYKMVDSLGYDSVLVFSVNADSAIYKATFTFVGQGNGDYIQGSFTALGKTFLWVAPDTVGTVITRRGSYAPIMRLVTPKSRKMATAGFDWNPDKNTNLHTEVAWTHYDPNKFSRLNGSDDDGFAVKAGGMKKIPLQKKDKPIKFITHADGEFVSRTFTRIQRFRAVEFERNWNVLNQVLTGDQVLAEAGVGLMKEGKGMLVAGAETFISGNDYSGVMAKTSGNLRHKGFRSDVTGSYLFSSGKNETRFMRHQSLFAQKIGKVEIGFKDIHEWNRYVQPGSDSLKAGSYQWYDYEVFAAMNDSAQNGITLSYRQRFDWIADTGRLSMAARADQYNAVFTLASLKQHKLKVTTGYRELKIIDPSLIAQAPENTFLGRLEYALRVFKNAIVASTFYETASGLELKKQFIYIEVPAGQGNYTWIDYNENGVKELNEFEIAAFPDQATYIRSFTPSNDYVRTYTNQFNQSLALNAPSTWSSKKGIRKTLARFSDQAYYRSEHKTNNDNTSRALNPFRGDIADSALVSSTTSFRNTAYFNRSSAVFGVDHTWQINDQKVLLTNGFESRQWISQELRLRFQVRSKIIVTTGLEQGERGTNSDFLTGRNYRVYYQGVKPEIAWQPGTTFRLAGKYTYTEKANDADYGGEKAFINDWGTELRLSAAEKGSLLANFNYIIIKYNGSLNNSLAFEMLNALKPGTNLTWSATWQQSLGKNMQLNLTYNGRKTENNRSIHTGGVQVRAFF